MPSAEDDGELRIPFLDGARDGDGLPDHGTGYEGDAETQCIFYLIENALLEIGSDGGVDERDFVSSSQQGSRDREDSKRCGCLSACEGWEEEDNFA